MSFLDKRRRRAVDDAQRVSLAEQFPSVEWDRETARLAAIGGVLEPALVPNERARDERKAAMLAEFARLHGRTVEDEAAIPHAAGRVVIADVEPVSDEEAELIAERFAALVSEQARQA